VSNNHQCSAIVVAGGNGTRFGSMKQFAKIFGLPVITWSVYELLQVADHIVIVVPRDLYHEYGKDSILEMISHSEGEVGNYSEAAQKYFNRGKYDYEYLFDTISVVAGGDTRSESVRCGLEALPSDTQIVVVHDAARPLARTNLFLQVIEKIIGGYDGATCYLPVSDTIKSLGEDGNLFTLDRNKLIAVQTPQAFSFPILQKVHSTNPEATDDIALLEAIEAKIALVKGDPANLKITEPHDIAILEYLVNITDEGLLQNK